MAGERRSRTGSRERRVRLSTKDFCQANIARWNLADGIGLYVMAKILSYSFLVISNRLRRSEVTCRRHYESDGVFQTVPLSERNSLTHREFEASQISGTEISRVLKVFFAKSESSEKILASLKPWGYAGIQSLSSMIIDEAYDDGTLTRRSDETSKRYHQDHSESRHGTRDDAMSMTRAPQKNGSSITDVRPWLTPDAKWFPLIPCKYFSIGRCHKADDCTFLHPGTPEDKRSSRIRSDDLEASHHRDRTANVLSDTRSLSRDARSESYRPSPKVDERTFEYGSRTHSDRRDMPQEPRRGQSYPLRDDRDRYDRYARSHEYDVDRHGARRRYLSPQGSASAADRNVRRDYSRSPPRGLRRLSVDHTRDTQIHDEIRSRDSHDSLRHKRAPRYQEPSREYSRPIANRESAKLQDIYKPLPSLNTPRTSRPSEGSAPEQDSKRSPRDDYPALVDSVAPIKPSISVSAADIIKNAENLLKIAKGAIDDSSRTNAATVLNRYLTLQSRLPKVENNMHIYEYLLDIIERAPTDHKQHYFLFLQDYLSLTNRVSGDLNHMNAMLDLAESSTGDLQARAVPLLDRYMLLSSSLAKKDS